MLPHEVHQLFWVTFKLFSTFLFSEVNLNTSWFDFYLFSPTLSRDWLVFGQILSIFMIGYDFSIMQLFKSRSYLTINKFNLKHNAIVIALEIHNSSDPLLKSVKHFLKQQICVLSISLYGFLPHGDGLWNFSEHPEKSTDNQLSHSRNVFAKGTLTYRQHGNSAYIYDLFYYQLGDWMMSWRRCLLILVLLGQ